MDTNNIFYKIINGEAPCYKVYEDRDFLVILDIFPTNLGHCLIIPKLPAVDIFDLGYFCTKKVFPLAQEIAQAVKIATGADGIKIEQNNGTAAGQVIFYFHLHVVPHFASGKKLSAPPTPEQFEEMAAAIRKAL